MRQNTPEIAQSHTITPNRLAANQSTPKEESEPDETQAKPENARKHPNKTSTTPSITLNKAESSKGLKAKSKARTTSKLRKMKELKSFSTKLTKQKANSHHKHLMLKSPHNYYQIQNYQINQMNQVNQDPNSCVQQTPSLDMCSYTDNELKDKEISKYVSCIIQLKDNIAYLNIVLDNINTSVGNTKSIVDVYYATYLQSCLTERDFKSGCVNPRIQGMWCREMDEELQAHRKNILEGLQCINLVIEEAIQQNTRSINHFFNINGEKVYKMRKMANLKNKNNSTNETLAKQLYFEQEQVQESKEGYEEGDLQRESSNLKKQTENKNQIIEGTYSS